WQSAYALVMEEAPEDYLVVGITLGLGRRAADRGDLARAEAFLAQSLQLCRRHRPGTLQEAETLRELGRLQARRGKWQEGSGHLCEALAGIEAWHAKLQARLDTRHWWGRFSADYHRDCADSLVQTGRNEDAFAAIERGRARAFLDLLAERGLRLAALAPERGAQWRQLNAEYERAQEDLRRAGAREATLEEVVNLEGRLREIRRQKERLLERDLPTAAVRYRQPLRLAEARRSLEPGTVLLLYSIGSTRTLLFVLLPDGPAGAASPGKAPGWAVLSLPAGEADLKKKVQRFQEALVKDRFNPRGFEGQAKDLYNLLVRPAEPFLAGAERVVFAPDGPLHTLPFAALKRGDQFLVEWKPLHFTLSATAYSEQRSKRLASGAPGAAPRLVAFGDPAYAPALPDASPPPDDRGLRKLLGQSVAPLPATREEVLGIASLFPGARVFLGGQVNEDEVKEAVRGASLVHFAVHGVFNERAPQNSALVLSAPLKPGEEASNALLQGWEVMESLPLDADLVTLSACDTALGRELGGEGLVGLTRAFQYAGARSVVATLWGISDRSTADFMKKFYGALQEGKTKDEALRVAQIAQIRSRRPQPFYWAAFQLFGDWR
ncbi:MAG TPA: CHAT domain-containing tetratricopeptide repeat protein, partial [Thermoanaerobaculia bacterium]|nr:CHAT domain-containing tetratricopeptide repeat protein [Thermoanaerobaculia bacterium]